MNKYIEYFRLMRKLRKRMTNINEMMDLKEMADVYSKYACKKNNWNTYFSNYLNKEFCEIAETKAQSVEVLQKVMEKYETSKTNIATIVNAFKKEIMEEGV